MPASGQDAPATGGPAMFRRGIWCTFGVLGALFLSCSTYALELNGVAHRFLQRHGVPCLFILKVGSPHDLGEVVTCQDGREWALFWLEDEIAFVQPPTRELYKWDREIYISYPELYGGSKRTAYNKLPDGDGPERIGKPETPSSPLSTARSLHRGLGGVHE